MQNFSGLSGLGIDTLKDNNGSSKVAADVFMLVLVLQRFGFA